MNSCEITRLRDWNLKLRQAIELQRQPAGEAVAKDNVRRARQGWRTKWLYTGRNN